MKLKTKVLFSLLSIVMMLSVFAFTSTCADIADSYIGAKLDKEINEEKNETKIELASNKEIKGGYIVKETLDGYIASKNTSSISDNDLQLLIEKIEIDGGMILFDNVSFSGSLTFTKNLTLSGSLSLQRGNLYTVSKSLVLDDFSLMLSSGSVIIKSGTVSFKAGVISALDASAFNLSYSAFSSLSIEGGEVYANTTDGAIFCTLGSVSISGGKISNSYGYAIINESSLILSGTPEIVGFLYDIKTKTPITLSCSEKYFGAHIDVIYDAIFERGNIDVVFRAADSDSIELIDLFDSSGESVELSYFESSPYFDERNFIAVYLPYSVKFYSEGSLFDTVYFLENEAIAAQDFPLKSGYKFNGWYTDASLSEAYIFGKRESGDISLFAGYSLMPPEFKINSKSFVYDGEQHMISFDSLTHPLAQNGEFSFEWFKDSEIIPYSSSCVPIRDVLDSGAYKCKLTFTYNGDFIAVTTPEVIVSIEKAVVQKPILSTYSYTGHDIVLTIPYSNLYSFDYSPSRNSGIYPVTFTLTDFDNYRWSDSDNKYTSSNYEIVKSENKFTSPPIVKDGFEGGTATAFASVLFGEIKVLYSSDGVNFSEISPTESGDYFLKITVPECDNYYYLESEVISFKIQKEVPIGIKLDKVPLKTEYSAFDIFNIEGAEFSVTYNSGRVEKADRDELVIKYKLGNSFLSGDTCVIVIFKSVSVPVTVNVKPAEYDISNIKFENENKMYNGKRQTISAIGSVIGKDGIPLVMKVSGGGVDAGEYSVTLSFESESLNYELPSSITKKLIISPLEVDVIFSSLEFTYDGFSKQPIAYAEGAEGRALPILVSGVAIDAGIYLAKAHLSDNNYILKNDETYFEILKADIDLSGVFWSGESFIYNGLVHSVEIGGLPGCVSFVGYTDSSFIGVGEYTATASILYDTKNYNAPEAIVHKWSIKPADYDFSDCKFIDSEFVFDGEIHYPVLVGELPKGADGSVPEYSFSRGVLHVSEGNVTVTVMFKTESKNYNTPDDITAKVKIVPKAITASWESLSFVYDGKHHIPKCKADECEISVTGEASDAGSYTATAKSECSDYTVTNSEVVFVIAKANNYWKIIPSIGVQFEGRVPAPHAGSASGEVYYTYYADKDLKQLISPPKEVGTYYVVAYVPESQNYNFLSYAPIEFSITAVVPVRLDIDFKNTDLVAKEPICANDINAYLINNDGTAREIPFADLKVKYQNGNVLLAKDSFVEFTFGEFYFRSEISVKKADYDMSEVYWNKTEATYSGEKIISELCGLPDGVEVLKYLSNSGICAGEYELSAVLVYDSENYNEPILPKEDLVIKKAELKIPELEGAVYDGTLKMPNIPHGALYETSFGGAKYAGIYEIILIPKDPENYYFNDGGKSTFRIEKRKITAEISENGKEYDIISGNVCEGDDLGGEFYSENGYVYLKIGNTNYDLTVIPAVEKSNSAVVAFLIFLIFVLLGLAGIIAYKKRALLKAYLVKFQIKLSETKVLSKSKSEEKMHADQKEDSASLPLETLLAVDEVHANNLISDALAKNLVTDHEGMIETNGKGKAIINIDVISDNFAPGDIVDINKLKEKKLIPHDCGKIKVLAGGVIDKPLTVIADSFSLSAVKMIALTGGVAKKTHTLRKS